MSKLTWTLKNGVTLEAEEGSNAARHIADWTQTAGHSSPAWDSIPTPVETPEWDGSLTPEEEAEAFQTEDSE